MGVVCCTNAAIVQCVKPGASIVDKFDHNATVCLHRDKATKYIDVKYTHRVARERLFGHDTVAFIVIVACRRLLSE